jgi:hypothetical protein
MIDINKPVEVVTDSGSVCKARIVASDVNDEYSIVVVWGGDNSEYVTTFKPDGTPPGDGLTLRNVKIKREGWILVSAHNQWAEAPYGTIYKSRKDALSEAGSKLTIAKIQWDDEP